MIVASGSSSGLVSMNHSVTFPCVSESLEFEIPVFVDTYYGKLPTAPDDERFLTIYELLKADGIYKNMPSPSEFSYFPDKCRLSGRNRTPIYPIDISLFVTEETQFGIAYLKPDSSAFGDELSAVAIVGSIDPELSYPMLLRAIKAGETNPIEDVRRLCGLPDSDLKPDVVPGTGSLSVSIQSLGLASGDQVDEFRNDYTGITAFISSSTKGIVLPSPMFDYFLSKAKSINGKPVEQVGTDLIVHECLSDRSSQVLESDAFSLIVSLKGQGTTGIRIRPERYMRKIADGKCVMEMFRGDQDDTVILGDALFKSTIIEFSSNHGLRICPLWPFRVPLKSIKLPKVDGRFESNESKSSSFGLLISILVAGIVLIGGLVAWFVMRARKNRTHVDRFSPTRPMVADPSDVSSMASAEHL